MSTNLQDTKAGDTLAKRTFGGDVELLRVIRTTKTQVIVQGEYVGEQRYLRTGYPVGMSRGRGAMTAHTARPAEPADFLASARRSAARAAGRLTEALIDRTYDHPTVVEHLEALTQEIEHLTSLEQNTTTTQEA